MRFTQNAIPDMSVVKRSFLRKQVAKKGVRFFGGGEADDIENRGLVDFEAGSSCGNRRSYFLLVPSCLILLFVG